MISSVLLLSALALAPIIGGKFGELASGILQIAVLVGICCRLIWAKGKSAAWPRVPGMWILVAFIVLCIVSTIFSRAVFFSLSQILFYAACLGAFLLAASVCQDRKMATAAVWILMVCALVISALGVRSYVVDTGGGMYFLRALLSSGEHSRIFGTFLNPGFFAGYLVIALPITLGIYLVTRHWLLVVAAGLAFTVEALAMLLTGAKFGIIAAVAALGLFFAQAIATRALRRSRFIRLVALCVILTPLLMLFSSPVRSRIQAAETGGTQVHSTIFRVYTWQATVDMIKAQPWLGTGPGTYPITYQQHTIAGPTRLAHNSYLQMAAECGVPAAGTYLLFLLTIAVSMFMAIIRPTSRSDNPRESTEKSEAGMKWTDLVPFSGWRLINCAMFAGLVGSAVRSLADSDWYIIGISISFWVVAGVLAARSGVAEKAVILSKKTATTLAAVCVLLIALSCSFALGDFFAIRAAIVPAESPNATAHIISLYKNATVVSPLMPTYHRQLAEWLGVRGLDPEPAYKQVNTAIKLARHTAEGGWFVKGVIAEAQSDTSLAISSFNKALIYHPNSTRTLFRLALIYRHTQNQAALEGVLRRLIAIEESDYENIKGTPEIIDGTFAYAHAYFGDKYLSNRYYSGSIREYQKAINRLERWRSSGTMRDVQMSIGMISQGDAEEMLILLRECYFGLAEAYKATGNDAEAAQAAALASKIKWKTGSSLGVLARSNSSIDLVKHRACVAVGWFQR